jgi:DNA invertase Pin-like site-specific DNA recombinase
MPVIGYTTFSGREGEQSEAELDRQTDLITRACDQRGLELVQVVGDPHTGRPLFGRRRETPPGLSHALGRIAVGEARGLVVPGLRRLAGSLAALGPILEWFTGHDARLVAVAQGLDTTQPAGRLAARLLIEVSQWEQHRCWDPAAEDKSPSTDLASSEAGDKPDLLSRSGGESS